MVPPARRDPAAAAAVGLSFSSEPARDRHVRQIQGLADAREARGTLVGAYADDV
ncbi:hypothetical protein ABZ690_32680 [Streptomyces sp. NPDC006967]|uniref:hypothetical protein n=1 Tax=Streptomyces sp. NPDC006967 TaxID=3156906 RepID=UPI003404F212